ncbi:MAG: hypothetical protein WC023_06465 [Rhodocyclaceae bacterium]
MHVRIKSWTKFQHFKDRRPPWVKLYRALLDDMEWHQLEPHAAKTLVMLWLIASENEGWLPEAKTLAFRLRTTEPSILETIDALGHWLEHVDINEIPERYQDDAPERETEESRESDRLRASFEQFWAAYPKREGRGAAEKAFAKVTAPMEAVLAAVKVHCEKPDWQRENGRYIPMPATWLDQRRWEDGAVVGAVKAWHETKSGVEARAAELGLAAYDGLEQFPTYKARVMAAHGKGAH